MWLFIFELTLERFLVGLFSGHLRDRVISSLALPIRSRTEHNLKKWPRYQQFGASNPKPNGAQSEKMTALSTVWRFQSEAERSIIWKSDRVINSLALPIRVADVLHSRTLSINVAKTYYLNLILFEAPPGADFISCFAACSCRCGCASLSNAFYKCCQNVESNFSFVRSSSWSWFH